MVMGGEDKMAAQAEAVAEAARRVNDAFDKIGYDNVETLRHAMCDIVSKVLYELQKSQREMVDICNRAASEIDEERRANALLLPRAEAFDAVQQVLGLMPQRNRASKEDFAWRLRQRARELLEPL